jgi:molecular chaperone GrpE
MAEKPEGEANESHAAGDQAAQQSRTETDSDAVSADPVVLAEQLASANEQITALKDQALRGQAEAENARRRAARDVENAHKYALEKFIGDLLPVFDSLEKAIESAQTAAEPGTEAIVEGLQLSMKLFLDVVAKAGAEQLDPLGEPFDPQHHEAMAMVPNPDMEPNSVMEVMQKGYTLNGRLVWQAMVVVSKAPG